MKKNDIEKPSNVRNRPLIALLFFTFKKKVNDLLSELLDNEYFLRNKEWSPTSLHCDWYVLVEFILVAWNLYDKSLERWCCLWFFNHLLISLLHVVRFSERINEKQINRIWKIIRLINTIWTFIIIILLNNFEKNKR